MTELTQMKKIVLHILAIAFVASPALANDGRGFSTEAKSALKSEKSYLLAVIPGAEGEYQIGNRVYGKPVSDVLNFLYQY